ncbi:hypothetical protein ACFYYH_29830 [Streptomyces sp. NPDC002018]|uniref:hypothetical protein n=1 Tax=Streptomyces sp. NPDC002018 TaxID=3364629 RepID=UPI003687331F
MLRRRLRFAAVLVVVVMALTGFSSGKGKSKGSSGGGGGGGGCSSSKKSNAGYAGTGSDDDSDYDSNYGSDDGSYGSSGGSQSDPYPTGPTATVTSDGVQVRVVTCVRKASGKRKAVTYATVRVEAAPGVTGVHEIEVDFKDASGRIVDSADAEATLSDGQATTVRVPMDFPKRVTRVRACEARAVAGV